MRYEIDVAREARDVYKGQRDSLRDEVSALKSNCHCGATATLKRVASSSVAVTSAPRATTGVKSSAALGPPPPVPPAAASISPRRGRSPPPMSLINASASAPPNAAPPIAGGGMFNSSAPPTSRQYVELDAIEMPGETAMPSYDFVPPSRGDSTDGGGDANSGRYALGVQRSAPPVPMHPPQPNSMIMADDGNYRPLPLPTRAPAVYVPVPLQKLNN